MFLSYRQRDILRKIFIVLGILLLVGAILGAFYFVASIGPKRVDPISKNVARPQDAAAAAKQMLERSRELERQYMDALELAQPKEEHVKALTEAIALRERYLTQLAKPDRAISDQIRKMRSLLEGEKSRPLKEESRRLETEAQRAEEKGQYAFAVRDYRAAAALQSRINREFPLSKEADVARQTRLERLVTTNTARPLWEESKEQERKGQEAMKAEQWNDAMKAFRQAQALQRRLNIEFGNTRFADVPRVDVLQTEIVSLLSAEPYAKIQELVKQAEELVGKGEELKAADIFQEALRRQRELNTGFPGSRFASQERVDELDQLRQTLLSSRTAREINAQAQELSKLLRERKVPRALELLSTLSQKATQFRQNYPRSNTLDAELVLQLQFLNYNQREIAGEQEAVLPNLIPVPNAGSLQMLKTEVPQALYSAVMGTNPSRRPGEKMPVETVTYQEAQEFCRRLSWILARPVRLPTEAEFRSAVGELKYIDLDEVSWHAENSGGNPHPVATRKPMGSGFYDVLGNVSEWLQASESDSPNAHVIGGNAQMPIDKVANLPVESVLRKERNRVVGFRVVVDMSGEAK